MKRLFVAAIVVAACSEGAPPPPERFDLALTAVDTVVSLESELIGHPTDLDVDADGRVWIADSRLRRVLVVNPDGSVERTLEGEGEGPGEFGRPSILEVRDGRVRVLDPGNMRAQDYGLDGSHIADHPFASPVLGAAALAGDRIILPTFGQDSAIVEVHALFDTLRVRLGPTVVRPPAGFDFTAMKKEIAEGGIPAQMRNGARAAGGSNGVTWVVLQTESEIRKYGSAGDLLWSRTLDLPEAEQARREFFRRNAETDEPFALYFLETFAAVREVDGDLWLLIRGEPGAAPVLYAIDGETGELRGRVTVSVNGPAHDFAVDVPRGRLYLGLPDDAAVLAADLPPEVRGDL